MAPAPMTRIIIVVLALVAAAEEEAIAPSSSSAGAGIGAGKQIILVANCDATQTALGGVVVERQAAVVEAARQRSPARPHIAEGLGEFGLAGERAHGLLGPSDQGLGNRL